jgi:hypothetical protein
MSANPFAIKKYKKFFFLLSLTLSVIVIIFVILKLNNTDIPEQKDMIYISNILYNERYGDISYLLINRMDQAIGFLHHTALHVKGNDDMWTLVHAKSTGSSSTFELPFVPANGFLPLSKKEYGILPAGEYRITHIVFIPLESHNNEMIQGFFTVYE